MGWGLAPAAHLSFWLDCVEGSKTFCVEFAQGDQNHGQRSGHRETRHLAGCKEPGVRSLQAGERICEGREDALRWWELAEAVLTLRHPTRPALASGLHKLEFSYPSPGMVGDGEEKERAALRPLGFLQERRKQEMRDPLEFPARSRLLPGPFLHKACSCQALSRGAQVEGTEGCIPPP